MLAALALLGEFRRPLNPDAAWLLYSSIRLLRGERLYVDILEINPPLIIWLNLPVALLSWLSGLPSALVFRVMVVAVIAASCATWVTLLSRMPGGMSVSRRGLELAGIVFVLLPMVGGMFGQREHLLLALSLPLVALTALRVAGVRVATGAALGIGLASGIGLGLKPHYAAAWLLLVAYRWWAGGRAARRILPEDGAVLAVGVTYVLLVVLLTPDYFPFVGGVARDYMSYGSQPLLTILVSDSPALWFYVAVIAWLALDRRPRESRLGGALTAAGLGTVVAIAAQHKGWSYHYLPLTGLAFLLALTTLWPAGNLPPAPFSPLRWASRGTYAVLVVLFAGVLSASIVQRAFGALDPREARQVETREVIRRQAGARTILVLSSQLRDGFPLVNDSGLRCDTGYPNVWLPLVYYRTNKGPSAEVEFRPPAAMPRGERAAFDRVVRDLVDGRPDVLVVESPELNARRMEFPGGFDFLRYFSQDQRFAAALTEYRRDTVVDSLWILRRRPGA